MKMCGDPLVDFSFFFVPCIHYPFIMQQSFLINIQSVCSTTHLFEFHNGMSIYCYMRINVQFSHNLLSHRRAATLVHML